jgi:hypothetical protein
MIHVERKIGNGNLTPENLIDEDFEAELGPNMSHVESVEDERVKIKKEMYQKIDHCGIVSVSGSDKSGRMVIILAACNLPNKFEIEKLSTHFQNQQHFFEVLLE